MFSFLSMFGESRLIGLNRGDPDFRPRTPPGEGSRSEQREQRESGVDRVRKIFDQARQNRERAAVLRQKMQAKQSELQAQPLGRVGTRERAQKAETRTALTRFIQHFEGEYGKLEENLSFIHYQDAGGRLNAGYESQFPLHEANLRAMDELLRTYEQEVGINSPQDNPLDRQTSPITLPEVDRIKPPWEKTYPYGWRSGQGQVGGNERIILSFSTGWGREQKVLPNISGNQGAMNLGLRQSLMINNIRGQRPLGQEGTEQGFGAWKPEGEQMDNHTRALEEMGIHVEQTPNGTFVRFTYIPENEYIEINGEKIWGPIGTKPIPAQNSESDHPSFNEWKERRDANKRKTERTTEREPSSDTLQRIAEITGRNISARQVCKQLRSDITGGNFRWGNQYLRAAYELIRSLAREKGIDDRDMNRVAPRNPRDLLHFIDMVLAGEDAATPVTEETPPESPAKPKKAPAKPKSAPAPKIPEPASPAVPAKPVPKAAEKSVPTPPPAPSAPAKPVSTPPSRPTPSPRSAPAPSKKVASSPSPPSAPKPKKGSSKSVDATKAPPKKAVAPEKSPSTPKAVSPSKEPAKAETAPAKKPSPAPAMVPPSAPPEKEAEKINGKKFREFLSWDGMKNEGDDTDTYWKDRLDRQATKGLLEVLNALAAKGLQVRMKGLLAKTNARLKFTINDAVVHECVIDKDVTDVSWPDAAKNVLDDYLKNVLEEEKKAKAPSPKPAPTPPPAPKEQPVPAKPVSKSVEKPAPPAVPVEKTAPAKPERKKEEPNKTRAESKVMGEYLANCTKAFSDVVRLHMKGNTLDRGHLRPLRELMKASKPEQWNQVLFGWKGMLGRGPEVADLIPFEEIVQSTDGTWTMRTDNKKLEITLSPDGTVRVRVKGKETGGEKPPESAPKSAEKKPEAKTAEPPKPAPKPAPPAAPVEKPAPKEPAKEKMTGEKILQWFDNLDLMNKMPPPEELKKFEKAFGEVRMTESERNTLFAKADAVEEHFKQQKKEPADPVQKFLDGILIYRRPAPRFSSPINNGTEKKSNKPAETEATLEEALKTASDALQQNYNIRLNLFSSARNTIKVGDIDTVVRVIKGLNDQQREALSGKTVHFDDTDGKPNLADIYLVPGNAEQQVKGIIEEWISAHGTQSKVEAPASATTKTSPKEASKPAEAKSETAKPPVKPSEKPAEKPAETVAPKPGEASPEAIAGLQEIVDTLRTTLQMKAPDSREVKAILESFNAKVQENLKKIGDAVIREGKMERLKALTMQNTDAGALNIWGQLQSIEIEKALKKSGPLVSGNQQYDLTFIFSEGFTLARHAVR